MMGVWLYVGEKGQVRTPAPTPCHHPLYLPAPVSLAAPASVPSNHKSNQRRARPCPTPPHDSRSAPQELKEAATLERGWGMGLGSRFAHCALDVEVTRMRVALGGTRGKGGACRAMACALDRMRGPRMMPPLPSADDASPSVRG